MKFKLELVQGHHMNPALEVVVTWTPWTVLKRPICLLILDAFSFLIKFNKWPTIFVSILIFVDSHRLSHSRLQSSFFFFFKFWQTFIYIKSNEANQNPTSAVFLWLNLEASLYQAPPEFRRGNRACAAFQNR